MKKNDLVQIIDVENRGITLARVEQTFDNGSVIVADVMVWDKKRGMFSPKYPNFKKELSVKQSSALLVANNERILRKQYIEGLRFFEKPVKIAKPKKSVA